MKMRLLATGGLSALLLGTLLFLHSCNKNPQATGHANAQQKDENAGIKTAFSKKGHPYTVPVNQKMEVFYADGAGQRISTELLRQRSAGATSRASSFISACDYTNTPVVTLNTYAVAVNCNQDFYITWNYTISTNNKLVLTNSYVPTAQSKGSVKITDGSGSTIYSQSTLASSIVDLGTDNSTPGYELYSITFTSGSIAISNFSGSNTIKLGGLVVTDCPDVEPVSIAIQSFTLSGINGAANNPCLRVDAAWVVQASPMRIYGEDPAGFCNPYVYPSMQEVQYSIDGGVTWVGETATSTLRYWAAPPPGFNTPFNNYVNAHLGYVDPVGALELQIDLPAGHTYNIQVRYRNIVFNGTLASYGNVWPLPVFTGANANCCTGPWSAIQSYPATY